MLQRSLKFDNKLCHCQTLSHSMQDAVENERKDSPLDLKWTKK